jgi:SOS-response transcriptional repressor LexA
LGAFTAITQAYEADQALPRIVVQTDTASPPHALAVRLVDDAMGERFPAGSIVVIVDNRLPKANDFVVGILPGKQAATMRQWAAVADRHFLLPSNRNHQAAEVTPDFRIFGVVVEAVLLL